MKDIELKGGDIIVRGGTIQPEDSLQRHRVDLLQFNKGDNVFFPTLGVGVMNYLNGGTNMDGISGALRVECNRDGIAPPRRVGVVGQSITIYD